MKEEIQIINILQTIKDQYIYSVSIRVVYDYAVRDGIYDCDKKYHLYNLSKGFFIGVYETLEELSTNWINDLKK